MLFSVCPFRHKHSYWRTASRHLKKSHSFSVIPVPLSCLLYVMASQLSSPSSPLAQVQPNCPHKMRYVVSAVDGLTFFCRSGWCCCQKLKKKDKETNCRAVTNWQFDLFRQPIYKLLKNWLCRVIKFSGKNYVWVIGSLHPSLVIRHSGGNHPRNWGIRVSKLVPVQLVWLN
jgi:hypothetical protein